jgi:hypothetical protein
MTCEGILFEHSKLKLVCEPHYRDNPDSSASPEDAARYQREEDEWAAREMLGQLVVHRWPEVPLVWAGTAVAETWQSYLMYLLKPVCRHYGVSDEAVLQGFMRHFLPSILLSEKHGQTDEALAFRLMLARTKGAE